jgi:hypothetical protein
MYSNGWMRGRSGRSWCSSVHGGTSIVYCGIRMMAGSGTLTGMHISQKRQHIYRSRGQRMGCDDSSACLGLAYEQSVDI